MSTKKYHQPTLAEKTLDNIDKKIAPAKVGSTGNRWAHLFGLLRGLKMY